MKAVPIHLATRRRPWVAVAVGAVAVLSAACGGGNGGNATPTSGVSSPTTSASSSSSSAAADPVARGKQLVGAHNCLSCHSTTGATLAGPTWKGLAGSTVKLSNGTTATADHDYLVRSVLDPDAQVVDGFSAGIMSAVIKPGSITPQDAEAIARYIESLG